ncbi:MAG TPA: flagellar basal body protein FliL [Rhodospirillales bacterium]|nr:flagellar basal body protein FliL [Rhodospirillales bacterium]
MAEDKNDEQDEELDDELDDDEDESSKGGSKKKLFIIIGAVLLLAVGGAAAAYFTGLMEPLTAMLTGGGGSGEAGEDGSPSGSIVFHDLPEILVNLNTGGRKSSFLKIRISLELASAADIPKIEGVMPRVIDNFQVYLRELRIEDLKGSAGMYRLREELLMRVSAAAAPATVNDVLFKEMIVQ